MMLLLAVARCCSPRRDPEAGRLDIIAGAGVAAVLGVILA